MNISVGAKVQIVCNPGSGGFSPSRAQRLARAYEAAGFEPVFAESSQARAFEPLPDVARICVAGGDGTVRHVLCQLVGKRQVPPIDIYPAGTINLIARERGAPRDPEAFVAHQLVAQQARLHPVAINDTYFMACASIAPDARAVASVSPLLKRIIGRVAYGVALCGLLLRWQRPQIRVHAADGVFDCEALYLANGRFFAGPWSFAPAARLDHPQVHIVALKRARRRDYLMFLIATMFGRADRLSNVRTSVSGGLAVVADSDHVVQADGDIIARLPADIQVGIVALPA